VTQHVLAPVLVVTQFAADPDWKPVAGTVSTSTAAEAHALLALMAQRC
jgi:hypothetical protein